MSDEARHARDAIARGTLQQHRETDEQVDWRNVSFKAPPSAPPHMEDRTMERLDHTKPEADAENARQAIAKQSTVEAGIAALFQLIATLIQNATEHGDASGLVALSKKINENPRDWSDAVLANTQAAAMTAGPQVPQMPGYVQDAFKSHGTLQHDQEQAQHQQREGETHQAQQQPQPTEQQLEATKQEPRSREQALQQQEQSRK
jgi:hypothetical protein